MVNDSFRIKSCGKVDIKETHTCEVYRERVSESSFSLNKRNNGNIDQGSVIFLTQDKNSIA